MAVNLLKKNSLALVASLLLAGHVQATELLNSSYDVSRELFAALNPPFEQQWAKDNGGDKLTIKQSHAGSSKQALAILQGLKADVVTYNQVTDVQILHDKGKLIPADWQSRLPNNSSPFYSTMGFLVRKGNPKNIHDWNDLVRSDVKLIFPNPKTSGNARYTYLAAWGAADKADGGDKAKTEEVWHDGAYHTGDIAWIDEDGHFWYVGRTDDVIKSSGYRIGPFEIESVIMELPYVVECGVTGAHDDIRGQVVKAVIVLTKGTEPTEELKKEIQHYVKEHTAPYKYPRIVEFREKLPKTISGKIIRNQL